MSGILQNFAYGKSFGFPYGWPVANIGDAYGGGYFAGQINISGTIYNLVVAPKASGTAALPWQNSTIPFVSVGTSVVDGLYNTNTMAALGLEWEAATFCKGLTIGGYTDWYLPSRNEYEVLFYYLKPGTFTNSTSYGANANAVAPEPINTNHTATNPPQTSATAYKTGGSEAFSALYNWTSTEASATNAFQQNMTAFGGAVGTNGKFSAASFRAIRRVLA